MKDIEIKICGISDINILDALCNIEIDYAGFIFFNNSPRNVTAKFLNKVTTINFKKTRPVCVFVNPNEADVYEAISFFENPILQFHGNETKDFCESFGFDYWKAIHMESEVSLEQIDNYDSADAFLLETYKADIVGGTGEAFDWSYITTDVLANNNIVLSGGINLKNVDNALKIKPWCLDINSGVESEPGIKDITLINTMVNKITS